MRRLWKRLPVVVRAVLVGLAVFTVGERPPGVFFYANLQRWPTIPWSVAPIILWLWIFWQYFGGRWWPLSTAQSRAEGLAARSLSRHEWRWALVAGGLGMTSVVALHLVLSPITPPTYNVYYKLFRLVPFPTLVLLVITLSAVAGIIEEAAFRGYMQGSIERRHGPVVAIAVTTFVFVLMHFGDVQEMSAPRTLFIAVVSVMYGVLRHLTRSILPGIILHSAGDAYSIMLLWFYWVRGAVGEGPIGFANASKLPVFWLDVAELFLFTAASVWAFRKLALSESESR
jgi:membrane protease YdiL (CAAX protease family)